MSVFKFKQFEVDQGNCPMKINTDGVILGATALHPAPKRILDIGTGTGVIAMMLAQRFPEAEVQGIDIDALATETASNNFKHSAFAARMQAFNASFEDFKAEGKYDLIVSNPPYFVNDLRNNDPRKELARHTAATFFETLVEKSAELLTPTGTLCLVLPPERIAAIATHLQKAGLNQSTILNICSFEDKPAFRQVVSYTRATSKLQEENLVLYHEPGVHSAQYRALLKDFFLAF